MVGIRHFRYLRDARSQTNRCALATSPLVARTSRQICGIFLIMDSQVTRSRQRVLESAVVLMREGGLPGNLVEAAAEAARVPISNAKLFFQNDEELILALYLRLANDLEVRASALPPGGVAERFRALMQAKLGLVKPYRLVRKNAGSADQRRSAEQTNGTGADARSRGVCESGSRRGGRTGRRDTADPRPIRRALGFAADLEPGPDAGFEKHTRRARNGLQADRTGFPLPLDTNLRHHNRKHWNDLRTVGRSAGGSRSDSASA